jgi:hypothetical protein
VLDVLLGREQPEREQQRGHRDHEDADAVDADDVANTERGYPGPVLDELEVDRLRAEVPEQPGGEPERDRGGGVTDRLGDLRAARGHEQGDQRARKRDGDDHRQDREVVHG